MTVISSLGSSVVLGVARVDVGVRTDSEVRIGAGFQMKHAAM